MMKAYNLVQVNDLRYEDVKMPELQCGWALVEVRACGICSSDIPRIFSKGTYHFPTIPGHEFSGIVVQVADECDREWLNKRVSVFPLIPCKKCPSCQQKHYETCSNYNYLGSRCDGGFAEYVAVPVWNLIELDDNISFEVGAMFEPLAVALHCVNQARLQGNERVAVIGNGTIAFAIAQWAEYKNVKSVCVIGRTDNKKQISQSLNIEYYTADKIAGQEFDVVIEAVGTNESLNSSINLAASGGRVVLMGNPYGDMVIPQQTYWRILRKQLEIIGTWNSSYDGKEFSEWMEVRSALTDKKIDAAALITHRFHQSDLMDGLKLMKEHKEPYCKIITLWNEGK